MATSRRDRVLVSFVSLALFTGGIGAIAACSSSEAATPVATADAASDAGGTVDAATCGVAPDAGAAAIEPGVTYPACITSEAPAVYELTAPASTAGGYFALHLTDVVGSPVIVTVTSLADGSEVLVTQRFEDDARVDGYVAVKGGTRYRITVARKQTYDETTAYALAVAYTPFVDAYEPNNDLGTAKPIALATDIAASTLDAYEGATTAKDESFWDHYAVEANAGSVVVTLTNPDPARRFRVTLFDAAGAELRSADSPSEGANVRLEATLAVGGTYKVRVQLFSYAFVLSGEGETAPPIFTTPYTLRVTQ